MSETNPIVKRNRPSHYRPRNSVASANTGKSFLKLFWRDPALPAFEKGTFHNLKRCLLAGPATIYRHPTKIPPALPLDQKAAGKVIRKAATMKSRKIYENMQCKPKRRARAVASAAEQ